VAIAADKLGVLLGAGLEIQIAWEAVAVAFEVSDCHDLAANALAYDANTVTGLVLQDGTWRHLEQAEAETLAIAASEHAKRRAGYLSLNDRRFWRQIKAIAANNHAKGK